MASTTRLEYVCCVCERETATRKVCGRCKVRNYCSVECQRRDWDRAHSAECREHIRPSEKRTIRALEVVSKDGDLIQMLSMLLYAVKEYQDGPRMRCLVLVVVNRPWEMIDMETNYCPLLFCVVQEMERALFVSHVRRNLMDTGQASLVDSPHKVPLLVLRSLEARLIDARHVSYVCDETANMYPWLPSTVGKVEDSAGSTLLNRVKHIYAPAPSDDRQPCTEDDCRREGASMLDRLAGGSVKDDLLGRRRILALEMTPGVGRVERLIPLCCPPHLVAISDPSMTSGKRVVAEIRPS